MDQTIRAVARMVCMCFVFSGAAAIPALADTLSELAERGRGGASVEVPADGAAGRADIDHRLALVGPPGAPARLSAPEDDAILVVLSGGEVNVSNVVFVQAGATRFGIYVDGGALTLEGCAFEGAFENAIYLASGSLTLKNCTIDDARTGLSAGGGATIVAADLTIRNAGDMGIFADGATLRLERAHVVATAGSAIAMQNGASLELIDSLIDGAGETGFLAIGAGSVDIDGLTVRGAGNQALVLQEVPQMRLRRLVVEPGWRQGLVVQSGGGLDLEGFALHGEERALLVAGMAGPIGLRHGRLSAGVAAQTAVLSDSGGLAADDVEIIGGEIGLYLTGAVPGAQIENVLAYGQSFAAFYVGEARDPSGAAPPRLDDLRAIASGKTLAMAVNKSPGVTVSGSSFLAAGPMAVSSQDSPGLTLSGNLFVSAPAPGLETQPRLVSLAGEDRPRFLADGIALPVDGSIAPFGNTGISTAAMAASAALPEEFLGAAVDFASGGQQVPGPLVLALEYIRPAPAPAREPAAATPRQSVALAPPEPGWVWDAGAAQVTLAGPGAVTLTLTPGDFPIDLAEGLYAVSVDGRRAGILEVIGPATLTLPLPAEPFFAWRGPDGTPVRGPTLYLRPKAELAALLSGMRPLLPGEFWGLASLYAPRRGADRAAAAAVLREARANLPAQIDAMAALQAAENWPAFNFRWQEVDITLDLFAAFGSADDAHWLTALALPDGIRIDNLETAVLIETRVGLLDSGATLAAARAAMADPARADDQPLERLLMALARQGHPEGLGLLAEYRRRADPPADPASPDMRGVIELSRAGPALAGELPSAFLDQLETAVGLYLSGAIAEGSSPPTWTGLWLAAASALAYEAVHGGTSGAAPRRLAIPVDAAAAEIGWLFADPVTLLQGRFGSIGPPGRTLPYGWSSNLGDVVCPALALRPGAMREAIITEARALIMAAVLDSGFADVAPAGSQDHQDRINNINSVLDYTLGDCLLSNAVVNHYGRDAAGEESAFFDYLDYEPLWWVRRPRAEAAMAYFGRGEEYPDFAGLSPYPAEVLTAALGPDHRADAGLLQALMTRHRLTTDAFYAPLAAFTFGAERRQFRLRNEGGNGSVTIAGYLDIRPLPDGERLIVAIRHEILSPDLGGLAAMITAPDRAPWEGEQRLRMFETVALDRGGVETPMTHAGTSAAGVHFFTAPWDGSLDDLTLHLGMRFWDATWDIAVPLWASALAHDQRRAAEDGR